MGKKAKRAGYVCHILRHNPAEINIEMDTEGWVSVEDFITGINKKGKHKINLEQLEEIVRTDKKGRYRFNEEHTRLKACQGHTIPWVVPKLEYIAPPEFLYHGTTVRALVQIMGSGSIKKMKRHAVHMQADYAKAWDSAIRWHEIPVVLKIHAGEMYRRGHTFGKTENDVWCIEEVPKEFIVDTLYSHY